MKKRTLLALAAAAAATLGSQAAFAQKIGVSMALFDDNFLTVLRNGIAEAGKKAGANVQIEDAKNDVGTQLSQMQNFVAQKYDAIIANNDEMAIGAINALKAAKKWTPNSIVAGIDATADALASMKAGELKVTVFQNAAGQGSGAVDAAIKLTKKQKVDRFVNVPFELVTPANLSKYAK